MTKYSHSRLSTFETCPLQYKFKYIDKIEAPFVQNDNTFLGSRCHEALEKLYRDRSNGKIDSKESILKYFEERWNKEYKPDEILHPDEGMTGDSYKRQGLGFIGRYYDEFFTNDRMEILGIETDDTLYLPDGNQYYVRIDKLGYMDGVYYVCDYKTDSKPKEQGVADSDRQLAMYALWVKKKYPDAKKVKLLWQMLKFTGDEAQVISERTSDQLNELEKSVVEQIAKIESTKDFPASKGPLCDYCVYKGICPEFPHDIVEIKDESEAPASSSGIDFYEATKLVDELVKNKEEIKSLKEKNDEIEEKLSAFAAEKGCVRLFGSDMDLAVKKTQSISYEDREGLEAKLKEKGIYDIYLKFDLKSFNSDLTDGKVDDDVRSFATITDSYSLRMVKKKDKED